MRYKNSGFTLIELLVAISILAIVALLGWRGLDGIVRSRDRLTSDLEQTRGLQLTFAQLQSDCMQNANPLSYPNMPEGRTSWIEPHRFILIRNEYIDEQPPSMQVVVYRIINSNVVRFESAPTRDIETLKQFLEQARNPPDNQVGIVMQSNVQDLEFSGYPESSLTGAADAGGNDTPPNPPNPPPDKKTDDKKPDDKKPDDKNPSASDRDNESAGNIQKVNQANVTTGLQVSLRLQNHDQKIIKIFMLGGA